RRNCGTVCGRHDPGLPARGYAAGSDRGAAERGGGSRVRTGDGLDAAGKRVAEELRADGISGRLHESDDGCVKRKALVTSAVTATARTDAGADFYFAERPAAGPRDPVARWAKT